MNPMPPRVPVYGNPHMHYGLNGNINQPQINIPQNNVNVSITEIKPPNNESSEENIPFPPEPEPEDIKIEKENN